MKLIFGDLHLLNEASDRYYKIIPMIKDALSQFGVLSYVDSVDFVGDVLDCEYVTYKRITYFSFVMNLITEHFSPNIRVLIGNHDKHFKNDEHGENIINYIKFDGEVVDSPSVIDRILYIPHYYNKDNFPVGLLNPDDFDVIIGHLGLEFADTIEELTLESVQKSFKGKTIISGHIHNMDLNFDQNSFFLGSLKSESWKEQSPTYSICLLDNMNPSFFVFPYHKIHLLIDVNDEDQFKNDLLKIFNKIHYHNINCCWYRNGDLVGKEQFDKYITSIINLKLRVFNKDIKKRDIDLIIDFCKHEIDDPSFIGINIKTIYQIENPDSNISQDQKDIFKIDKQLFSDQKKIVYDLIDDIKSGKCLDNLSNNKKFMKVIDSVTDGELERFAEFIVVSDKSKDFNELIKMIN